MGTHHENKKSPNISDIEQNSNSLSNENSNFNNVNASKNYYFNNSPKNLIFLKNITKDSYGPDLGLINTFEVFKSINNISYLIYVNENNYLISYDLNKQKIITELKNSHKETITSIKYNLNLKNKSEIIMTISYRDNNLKLWNVNNWEKLLNIEKVNRRGILFSGCFLKENKNDLIITSNLFWTEEPDPIKVFDFNGNKIKEINNSSESIYFIDSYYDNNSSKNYILASNDISVKSYDYNKNELYHEYNDKKYYDKKNIENKIHKKIIIKNNNDIIKLIESGEDGKIRIWNFNSGILLKRINIIDNKLRDILLWNDKYLFVGSSDAIIRLINLKKGKVVKKLEGHYKEILTIKKIIIKQYGECLITQGYLNDQIKLWINKQ